MSIYDYNRNMSEKKYRLKYLALLDIDNITRIVKDSTAYKDAVENPGNNKNALFHVVFDTIFSASSLYNQFLDYKNPYKNNFLGVPSKQDQDYINRLILFKLP